jgi:hypothetical protein
MDGTWKDVRPAWPDKETHLYGAGVDSGTYDHATNVAEMIVFLVSGQDVRHRFSKLVRSGS